MKIRNPELIGDIAVLFLTVGIFSWSFYNLGVSNGYQEYRKEHTRKLHRQEGKLDACLKWVRGGTDLSIKILNRLDEINKKIESSNQ